MFKAAKISPCGQYRYELTRSWDNALPQIIFVMLNPSTADAFDDDATIRKCIGFAKRNGFGTLRVYNLWAYRATDPAALQAFGWSTGKDNERALNDALAMGRFGSTIICAWGANARGRHEPLQFVDTAKRYGTPLYALKLTKDGIPCHPLMLPYSCEITRYA